MSPLVWIPAYVGIGSNLDSPEAQVRLGTDALAGIAQTQLIACSPLYRSKPLGPQDQPDFVNAVAGLLTQLDAHALLKLLKALEAELGRGQPIVRWGPRKIDFDLLVFGSERIDTDALKVPHPGLAERAFALVPLTDVAPHLEIPGLGRIEKLIQRVDRASVTPV